MTVLGAGRCVDPFRFQAHPEVWLLVAFLIGAYVYMVRVVGPHAVAAGQPVVTRAQRRGASSARWRCCGRPATGRSTTSASSTCTRSHMLQHMMLSYFLPPLALLATPEWLLRVLVGNGRAYAVLRWLCKPVVAGVLFNLAVMVTHIPGVVNASVDVAEPGPALPRST